MDKPMTVADVRRMLNGQPAQQADVEPPVTIETVTEKPMETVETVQIVPADEPKPKGKAKP